MTKKKRFNWIHTIGPGLIVGALVFGPSKLTITSKIGANFGYDLLWIIIIAIFFMAIFTIIAERIGMATDESLLTMIGKKWGKVFSMIIGIGIFMVCTSFQTGNSVGVGIAIGELTGTNNSLWILVFNCIGITLLFFRNFYKVLEKLMLVLIGMMLIAFLITLIEVRPGIDKIFTGFFVPKVPDGSVGLIIAFMASCFSIVGAFYTSYLVQARKKLNPERDSHISRNSSLTGIIVLGVLSAILMICAAEILQPLNIEVKTATDMSLALRPAFGEAASAVFLIGLFAAGFSSVIGNATIGGTLMSDALGYGKDFDSSKTRILIAIVMVIGTVIALLFGSAPLELIVFAQSITIFIVPVIGIAMFLIANNKQIMKENRISLFFRISGIVGLCIILVLAVINFIDIFIK
ncbi:MAG: Nramp family divalent metal transporter [Tannerella sp.]|nr:Nramp family divalent metal transporter [Tannerella sp.]